MMEKTVLVLLKRRKYGLGDIVRSNGGEMLGLNENCYVGPVLLKFFAPIAVTKADLNILLPSNSTYKLEITSSS